MRFVGIMFLVLVMMCGVVGLIALASHNQNVGFTDSYGNTNSNQTNSTQALVQNVTGQVAPSVGVGGILLVGLLLVACAFGVFLVFVGWGRSGVSSRR